MVYLFLRFECLIRNKTNTNNKTIIIIIIIINPPTAPPMAAPADPDLVSLEESGNGNNSLINLLIFLYAYLY